MLTPEKFETYNRRKAHNLAWQKEWREKRKSDAPPQPPKPLSQQEIIRRKSEGLPLTLEELERFEAWEKKRTEQHKAWRKNKKATAPSEPPKEKKPTKKEVISEIVSRKKASLPLTTEEQ